MEFHYPFTRIMQGVAFWLALALAVFWWVGGTAILAALAWVVVPALIRQVQRFRQRVRVDEEGLTVGETTLPWKQIRKVEMAGWGPWRWLEFTAQEKKKLVVHAALENYPFFATLVQQWLPPQAERPETLLA